MKEHKLKQLIKSLIRDACCVIRVACFVLCVVCCVCVSLMMCVSCCVWCGVVVRCGEVWWGVVGCGGV
jgi:hypothetical protein